MNGFFLKRMIRIYLQEELNILNQASVDINKLENELDVSWKKKYFRSFL